MGKLQTSISEEKFMEKTPEEQRYILYEAAIRGQEEMSKLKKWNWSRHPLAFVGGIIGGIAAKVGLG